ERTAVDRLPLLVPALVLAGVGPLSVVELERPLDVPDARGGAGARRRPRKRRVPRVRVAQVGAAEDVEDERAVADAAGDRPDLVPRSGKRHDAPPPHAAQRRNEPRPPAAAA